MEIEKKSETTSVVFYKSFYDAIQGLKKSEQLIAYKSFFEYCFYGIIPENKGIAYSMFILMKPSIDKALQSYRASVENGKRGGRPPKVMETQEKPTENLSHIQKEPNFNLDMDNDTNIDVESDADILLRANPSELKEEPLTSLTLDNETEFSIYQKQVNEWSKLYPSIDIIVELQKMKGWLNSNPKKRKTISGIRNFITYWLANEQNKGQRTGRQYESKLPGNVGNFEQRQYTTEHYESMYEDASKYLENKEEN